MNLLYKIQRRFLYLDPREASFEVRGFFDSSESKKATYEQIGESFIAGFNASIAITSQAQLIEMVERTPIGQQGFYVEGAAMAAKIVDSINPFLKKTSELFDSFGNRFKYLLHVGYGWALPRIPWLRRNISKQLDRLSPVLKYLAIDGFGFHECYFKWRESLTQSEKRKNLDGYQKNAFDQGVGRSLLFVSGGNVSQLIKLVAKFDSARLPDIWSGIGLAVGYAGGLFKQEIGTLALKSEQYLPNLAQGVCFAAEARALGENLMEHTELACKVVCGCSVEGAVELTRSSRKLVDDADPRAYANWRSRIANHFQPRRELILS